MKIVSYQTWPFRPEHWSIEESKQWWALGHLSGAIDTKMDDIVHWTILRGGRGSGKSVALEAWRRQQIGRALVVDYPPERWPGGAQILLGGDDRHLMQILAGARLVLSKQLAAHADQARKLNIIHREFLRWLMEKTGDPRAYRRLIQHFPADLEAEYQAVPLVQEFDEATSDAQQLSAITSDLAALVEGLGLERVVVCVDVGHDITPSQAQQLSGLFTWLTLMEQASIIVVAAVPQELAEQGTLADSLRSRVSRLDMNWNEDHCREIAARYLRLALPDAPADIGLDALAAPDLLRALTGALEAEYGKPTPAVWVNLVETLLRLGTQFKDPLSLPVGLESAERILSAYYAEHMKLRLDEVARGVWRGPRFIKLTDDPFKFLRVLRQAGDAVYLDNEELGQLVGSKGYLYTLVKRVREEIEPVPERHVYVINEPNRGYRLLNCL
jgi:hypothetical protein